jgi:signal transduction histidine kinase
MSAIASRSARLARIVHIASLVILVLVIGAAILGSGHADGPDAVFAVATLAVVGGFSTLGRLIVTRTGNAIGWVFLGIGAAGALGLPAEGYVQASYETPYVATLPGTDVAGLVAGAMPGVAAMAIPMLFLIFPTGKPPTRRWNWVGWLWLAGASMSLVWLVLRPGQIFGEPGRFRVVNPIGLEVLEPLRVLFAEIGTWSLFAAAATSIVSLVVRYRRSDGEERQQIKWLMLVAIAGLAILASLTFLTPLIDEGSVSDVVSNALWGSLVLVLALGIPTATALAIFRYRLYDVDVVISKTIVYAGLALFISLAYVAIVVGVGALLGGDDSNAALQIAATATVAVAFEPARERLQRFGNRLVYGKRATPYEVMSSFGQRMAAVPSIDDVLPDMAETAARGVGGIGAQVTLLIGDGGVRSVTWPAGAPFEDSTFALPVAYGGSPIGEIAVAKPANEPLGPAESRLLEDLAGHAGLALHNVRLASDLEAKAGELAAQTHEIARSRERLVTARDAQRRRLERELRDGIGTELAAIRDEVGSDAERVSVDPDGVQRSLDDLGVRANDALDELRDVARGIFPPLLIDKGLAAALESHVRKSAAGTTLEIDPRVAAARFEPASENAVYFCCIQALQNAQRHAPGAEVTIRLALEGPDVLTFVVRDDGSGFDPDSVEAHEGMLIMTDRVAALGGTLTVDSAPGKGTSVTGRIPARTLDEVVA